MEREIAVAAKWWSDQLRGTPRHDNGDGPQSAILNWASSGREPLPEEKIAAFESALVEGLRVHLAGTWRLDDPLVGRGLRCVGVDYSPHKVLADAAAKADIDLGGRLPVKTLMWISPGQVQVRAGYGAPITDMDLD